MSSHSERPTLPPLHTLNLLPASYAKRLGGSPYASYERPCQRLNVPQHSWSRRRVSTSTSSTTSRSPSPTPSDASSRTSASSTSSPTSPLKSSKLTLVPSSFEDAEAIVVIPPPDAPHVPGTRPGQGLLLMGPALEHVRHPQRRIAKGTRLHPYRFARRRASNASSLFSA
ncbi:hypothetical protein MVEN_02087200 [Mycena venus]|uniref:Uncharacterized protein n=1 Tax=Mycena venus TaxID=2733690 RepID=A0A8H6XD96_9AGAR|nr:hypothetical protein MVEN_02087200 [Mycena venus]